MGGKKAFFAALMLFFAVFALWSAGVIIREATEHSIRLLLNVGALWGIHHLYKKQS